MKLDRNENSDGSGKYALVNMRRVRALLMDQQAQATGALMLLHDLGVMDWGCAGEDDEFFPIKLKDQFAAPALLAYAKAANEVDPEFALEVMDLVDRAREHPNKKVPD